MRLLITARQCFGRRNTARSRIAFKSIFWYLSLLIDSLGGAGVVLRVLNYVV